MLSNTKLGVNLEPESSALVTSVVYDNGGHKKPCCEYCKKPWHTKKTC
jgi:hypothetical protein